MPRAGIAASQHPDQFRARFRTAIDQFIQKEHRLSLDTYVSDVSEEKRWENTSTWLFSTLQVIFFFSLLFYEKKNF